MGKGERRGWRACHFPPFFLAQAWVPSALQQEGGISLPVFLLREDLGSGLWISQLHKTLEGPPPQHAKVLMDTKVEI